MPFIATKNAAVTFYFRISILLITQFWQTNFNVISVLNYEDTNTTTIILRSSGFSPGLSG